MSLATVNPMPRPEKELDEALLVKLYVDYKQSSKQLATIFDVSHVTVLKRLRKHIEIKQEVMKRRL